MELSYENTVNSTVTNLDNINSVPQPVTPDVVGIPFTPGNPVTAGIVTNDINTLYTTPDSVNSQTTVISQANANVQMATPQQPVTSTTIPSPVIPNNVDSLQFAKSTVVPTQQPVAQQPVTESLPQSTPVTEKQPVAQPIVKNEFVVSAELLKKLVANAKKVGVFDVYVTASQVLDLTMDKNGITMITSNGQETYKCVDNTYVYTDILKCVVDISLFGDLVAALEDGDVEFTIDNNNVLTLHTSTGKFKFPERVDINVGQPLYLSMKFEQDYNEMTPVDYAKLVEIITHTKPARSAATSMDSIKGIYFSDIIICSDADIILMQQNLDNIQDKNFFMSSSFSDLICSIDFNTEKFRLGFVRDNMLQIVGIILSDGRTTICGDVQPDTQLPVDSCREYWKQQFPNTITLDTNKCLKVLKKVKPFIKQGTESDSTIFNILGDTLQIESLQGDAQDSINAKNVNSYVTKIGLPIVKMLDILQTVNSPTFDITIDPTATNYICLAFDNFKCIIGLSNDTQA